MEYHPFPDQSKLLQQEQVAVIPKASSDERRRANLNVLDFELNTEDMQEIAKLNGAGRIIDPGWAPEWD